MPTFDKVKAQAAKAAKLGPNPAQRQESRMRLPSPAQDGDFSPKRNQAEKRYLMSKPLSDDKGEPAKEV